MTALPQRISIVASDLFVFLFCAFSAELSTVVCITVDKARNILKHVKSPFLKHIILVFPEDQLETLRQEASNAGGIQVHSFDDILVRLTNDKKS